MPKREIWHPALYEIDDVRAIQRVAAYAQAATGAAEDGQEPDPPSPHDCHKALNWIINAASGTYENGFVADDPNGRIGAFIEGRRSVGQQIVKLIKLKPEALKKHE